MLKEWQFNILFFVGVGGAVLMLFGEKIGLDIASNPTSATGIGVILTYVLTQRKSLTKHDEPKPPQHKKEDDDGSA